MSWAQGQKGLSLPAAEAGREAVEMISLPARAEMAGVLPRWEGLSQCVKFSVIRASSVSLALPVGPAEVVSVQGAESPELEPAQPLYGGRQDRDPLAHCVGSRLSEL